MSSEFLLCGLILFTTAMSHMQLLYPPPFRSKYNPLVSANMNCNMTSPLSGPAQFPCKGYQSDLGTAAGASVVTWTAGSTRNFTLVGSATHGGGSCQAALSVDGAKSWQVIQTYQGGCPLSPSQQYFFDVPSDTPTGSAVFAWLWYNNLGNREIYMNCASITIAAGSGSASKVPFTTRPDLFVANLKNGCTTVEGSDVLIPHPGPNVTISGTAKQLAVSGICAPVNGIGGDADSVTPTASFTSTAATS
ncbi:extracellular protein, partial [Acephala macrosclerotiorum]